MHLPLHLGCFGSFLLLRSVLKLQSHLILTVVDYYCCVSIANSVS